MVGDFSGRIVAKGTRERVAVAKTANQFGAVAAYNVVPAKVGDYFRGRRSRLAHCHSPFGCSFGCHPHQWQPG